MLRTMPLTTFSPVSVFLLYGPNTGKNRQQPIYFPYSQKLWELNSLPVIEQRWPLIFAEVQ